MTAPCISDRPRQRKQYPVLLPLGCDGTLAALSVEIHILQAPGLEPQLPTQDCDDTDSAYGSQLQTSSTSQGRAHRDQNLSSSSMLLLAQRLTQVLKVVEVELLPLYERRWDLHQLPSYQLHSTQTFLLS